jgi:hypothetical protein
VPAVEIRADHGITGYTFSMGSQSQPLSEIESPRSMFAKSRLVSGRLASLAFCKAVHVLLKQLGNDLSRGFGILLICSIALLTTHSLNVIGAEGSAQADASQPVIEGMGLAPATQPTGGNGLKSTGFFVNPEPASEDARPETSSIKAFYSSSEPLVVSERYSATQFIVRETVLQSGNKFRISPPHFSAHGLQATDATLPNYVSVDIDGESQEEANSIYRISRSADSGALIVTLLRDLAIESPFEVTYQDVVRSPADLAPLTLPLAYRTLEGSIWHPIAGEAKTVLPGDPTRLAISAPSKASRSEPFNVGIVAMDQFGHPADGQPRSLDLRSEGKLIGRVSSDAETGLLSSEQSLNELTVTRFDARSPGGGLRGESNWIEVQRTPDRQLLWTDFSLEAMRALPSISFSAVEPFKGDDQLGAALTHQIVPMIDIPKPSSEALSEVGDPDPASGFNAAATGDLRERAIEAESAAFTDNTERLGGSGLIDPETDPNSEASPEPEPFAMGDQFGQSLALERANSASTDGSLAIFEEADATKRIMLDPAGVRDRGPALDRDSDATTPLAGTLADHSTSPRAEQSIQGTTEVADAVGQDAAYPFASSGQAGTNASIQVIESLSSNGTDNSNSIPTVNQKNIINQYDKVSLANISQNLTEELKGTISPEIQSRAVSMLRKWEAPRTGGETAYLHMDHPDYAWRIARPEATSDSRIGQYRGAVVLQGASAYPWMIDYIARRGEVFAILSDRVSATGDALATGPNTGIWVAPNQPWLVGFLNGQTVVTKGHQWPFRFTVNGGQGRVPHAAERRLAADFLSNESIVWIDWYKNGQRLRRQYDPERLDMPNSVSRPESSSSSMPEAASRYSSWDLMIAFESSSAPIAPGFTAPRNRREWLGYAAFDAEHYTMREVGPSETDARMKSLLADDGQRVDFLTSTHGAPSLIRIRSRELALANTGELNEDESSDPEAERRTSEIDADEPVIDTLTIALAEGFEDGLFLDENRLPQATPGAVFSIPLEELKIGPVTREFEVKGYRDRITVMLVTAQSSSDAEMNLDRKPIRRTATLVDRSEPKPGDYYWSHALLAGGTALWSSPVFVGGHAVSRSSRAADPSAQEPIDQALEAD